LISPLKAQNRKTVSVALGTISTGSPAAPETVTGTATAARLESVDLLRGFVMVVMALDHVRDFFTNVPFDPTDLARTYPALFLTRWITHFCAPVFIFLAGTGAYLFRGRGRSTQELSWFLFTRGLWLALLEVTWVRCLGWSFNFDFHSVVGAVLWAIGWSMVVLAALVFLPTRIVAVIGIAMIVTHNLFDGVRPEVLGKLGWLWTVLHKGGSLEIAPGWTFIEAYPLIPWIGVMAVGYAFGAIFREEPARRRRNIFRIGLVLTLAFIAVRFVNIYGDPHPWTLQSRPLFTVFSFLNCHKYPPSLLYLLMTIGPALMLLAWFDGRQTTILRPLLVFGRVPLFYYLIHLPVIHGLAVVVAWIRYGRADWLYDNPFQTSAKAIPPDNGFDLGIVYLIWILLVLALYPACRWFADLKARRKEAWLSYL
jgi:uncharacterized membrane protein